jgi:hypothetical protein
MRTPVTLSWYTRLPPIIETELVQTVVADGGAAGNAVDAGNADVTVTVPWSAALWGPGAAPTAATAEAAAGDGSVTPKGAGVVIAVSGHTGTLSGRN